MNYDPGPDSHIKNKFKVELDLSNYATGVDTFDLAVKKILLLNWLIFRLVWII